MRRFLLALILSTATASAQQPATSPLTGTQTNVVGVKTGIVGKVLDLKSRSLDLNFPVQDMGGKTVDLQVKETKTEIRISLSADILFDFDKSNILSKAAGALKDVASMIRAHPGAAVRIEGYTDAKGSDAYNQKLSERRANSVRQWLIAKEALKSVKFAAQGFGAKNPVAPNTNPDGSDDPDGRQKNRRVEIVIEK